MQTAKTQTQAQTHTKPISAVATAPVAATDRTETGAREARLPGTSDVSSLSTKRGLMEKEEEGQREEEEEEGLTFSAVFREAQQRQKENDLLKEDMFRRGVRSSCHVS